MTSESSECTATSAGATRVRRSVPVGEVLTGWRVFTLITLAPVTAMIFGVLISLSDHDNLIHTDHGMTTLVVTR